MITLFTQRHFQMSKFGATHVRARVLAWIVYAKPSFFWRVWDKVLCTDKQLSHPSAVCMCLCRGLHSHCPSSDWLKRGCVFLEAPANYYSDTPRHTVGVFVVIILSRELTTSEWVSEFHFPAVWEVSWVRSGFSLCSPSPHTLLSFPCPPIIFPSSPLSSTAPTSPGWAPAPTVSQ